MIEKPSLVAMMPVRNEADRYLEEVLRDLSVYVDRIVILDDASTDDTEQICRSFPKVVYHRNEESLFLKDESALMSQLWRLTMNEQPNWVLAIDADEIFEERMHHEWPGLIQQTEFDAVEFRLFDFWQDRDHYRIDGNWNPWPKKVRMLLRVNPNTVYTWPKIKSHCPRLPLEARGPLITYQSDIRVKHFGWVKAEDVQRKYQLYKAVGDDPHLQSVLADPSTIKLEQWIAGKVLPF